MKIYLSLILTMAFTVATHASVQTFVDQDKPTRLYVQSYTESVSGEIDGHYTETWTNSSASENQTYKGTLSENINYADNSAGSANCDQFEEIKETDYFPNDWPYVNTISDDTGNDNLNITSAAGTDFNSVSNNETENVSGSFFSSWNTGQESEPATANNNTSSGLGMPVYYEHCDTASPFVDYSSSGAYAQMPSVSVWNDTETFKRTAQTKMKLHAGGKAIPTSRNLFLLSGSASTWTTIDGSNFGPLGELILFTLDYGWYEVPTYFSQFGAPGGNPINLPNTSVSVGSLGSLDSNGLLYVGISAGSDVDVTFNAGTDRLLFGVGMTEYPLNITINGTNYSTATPQFSVGQPLAFQLSGLPSSVSNMIGQWHLPGNFVNQAYAYSSTCTSYVENASLLLNTNSTSCWYLDKPGGTASVGLNLMFSSGHTATVSAMTQFSLFRPTIANFVASTNIFIVLNTNASPSIYLGLGNNQKGAMGWTLSVNLNTNFPASLYFDQLVNRQWSWNRVLWWGGTVPESDDTVGFELDTGAPYVAATVIRNTNVPKPHHSVPMSFGDGPDLEDNFTTANCLDKFETYLEYQPVGGIPVTIGLINWGWHGDVTYSGGGTWLWLSNSITGPTLDAINNSLPVWNLVYLGN